MLRPDLPVFRPSKSVPQNIPTSVCVDRSKECVRGGKNLNLALGEVGQTTQFPR